MNSRKNSFLEIRGSNITIRTLPSCLYPVPHIHKEAEILYCKKGSTVCYVDNEFYKLSEGDMFVVFPNQIHYYTDTEFGEYQSMIFSSDMLYNLKKIFFETAPRAHVMHVGDMPHLCDLISKIMDEEPANFKETLRVSYLNQLIPAYLETTELYSRTHTDSTSSNLQRILNYCTQHFAEDISLVSVAESLHFSKYYVSHLLNDHLNIGFKKYINNLRINMAIDLIKTGEKNMTKIANAVGFGSIRSFNRAFVQIVNIPPRMYYKQFQENEETSYWDLLSSNR